MSGAISSLVVLGLVIIGGIISLLLTVFWIWMLVHAIRNKGLSDGEKVAWVLAVVFLPFLGSVLYCIIGRPKANQTMFGY